MGTAITRSEWMVFALRDEPTRRPSLTELSRLPELFHLYIDREREGVAQTVHVLRQVTPTRRSIDLEMELEAGWLKNGRLPVF
jgi:hypothetical protein